MKPKPQRRANIGASNEFIRDVSGFLKEIRTQPQFVKASHVKVLKRHQLKLRKIFHAKTPAH